LDGSEMSRSSSSPEENRPPKNPLFFFFEGFLGFVEKLEEDAVDIVGFNAAGEVVGEDDPDELLIFS